MAEVSRRLVTVVSPLAALLFGIDSMYLMLFRNNYMYTLARIGNVGPRHLPGSNIPIRARYIGVPPLDYWAAVMQTILANVTDGSAPRLSIYGFHFAGQLGSITTILMMEAMRVGSNWTVFLSFMPWGLAMTACGYAVIMPMYCIAHIFLSRTVMATSKTAELAKQVSILEYHELWTLPGAIVLGYGVPVLLMALPTFTTDWHQLFVAGWHLFPVWVTISQYLLRSINTYPLIITQLNLDAPREDSSGLNLEQIHRLAREKCLQRAYKFAYAVSASTHLATMATIFLTKVHPALMTSATDESVSFSSVFLPPYWRRQKHMQSFVQGTLNLLQYDQYAGSTAALIWGVGVYTLCTAQLATTGQLISLIAESLVLAILCGPAAALTHVMSRRDQQVAQFLAKTEPETENKERT